MNGNIDSLRQAVLTDARALAYEVMQEAIREREKIGAENTDRLPKERATAMAGAEAEAEKARQKILAEAEADIQRDRLAAREAMIARVLDETRKRLAAVASDSSRGKALLLALSVEGAKAVSGETAKLVVRPADRGRVDASFLAEVSRQSGKRAQLSEETQAGLGGVIVTSADGRERYDNTLDRRLERRIADVRALIWTRLSHAR